MFDSLFTYPAVLKRHREGPLASEREAYLRALAERGMARSTLVRRAVFCLVVAHALELIAAETLDLADVDALASAWAAERVATGRAASARWPQAHFRAVAVDLVTAMGRFRAPPNAPSPHHARVEDFIAAYAERWPSPATRRAGRWQIYTFLTYLDTRGLDLEHVRPADVDAYFVHIGAGWRRASIRRAGTALRAWFRHAELRGWVRGGVAASILLPRLYRHEGLPPGPTWMQVGSMIDRIEGDTVAALRDRALLMLLSTYGLRSGEVRRLQLDDLHWGKGQLTVTRSKSLHTQTLPLEAGVGNAIARYLRHGRPKTACRAVFLTLRAPYRALSVSALYHVVAHHLRAVAEVARGRGPHGLRHACARYLVESGHSFKEVGDQPPHVPAHHGGSSAARWRRQGRATRFQLMSGLHGFLLVEASLGAQQEVQEGSPRSERFRFTGRRSAPRRRRREPS